MNPIVRTIINIIDGFFLTMYAVVFSMIKVDYRKVALSSILLGISFAFIFCEFTENSYNNTLLQYSLYIVLMVVISVFLSLLFNASFIRITIGTIVYFAAEASGVMLVMTIVTYIYGDIVTSTENSIWVQIIGSAGVYPVVLIVLIISQKLLSTKLIGTIVCVK